MFGASITFAVLFIIALVVTWILTRGHNNAKDEYNRLRAEFDKDSNRYGSGPDSDSKWWWNIWRIIALILTALFGFLAALFLILSTFFAQDPGQATVVRNWSGALEGEPATTEGWHTKVPWTDTFTFDIRNQRVIFVGGEGSDSKGDNAGGEANGPQITVQDSDGVSSNIDITVTYSINPSAVADIYRTYRDADGLRANRLFNDIRSIVRSVPGHYTTLELLTERDKLQNEIREKLESKWEDLGIVVNDVALQEIRPPASVVESYATAQQAQIDVEKAKAQLESATVSAQQKVVQAQAEADANAILNASLTAAILQQRYLDTLKELAAAGNLVVVPEGFNGLVQVK